MQNSSATTPASRKYREVLDQLRKAFPQPFSDPVHDAYMLYSISRALDVVDDLKSEAPILGSPVDLDWQSAKTSRVADGGQTLEEVIPELAGYLNGMINWGHPRCQVNVVTLPSIASIIGVLLPSVYNPNLCSEETSRRLAEAEVRSTSMVAELLGYDPEESLGIFTFGGTGGVLYGLKIGLEKALPGCMKSGLRSDAVVLASDEAHYCGLTAAGWLGIGQDNFISVPTHADNSICIEQLESTARATLSSGKKIAAFIATMGTTDAFGLDDLEAIYKLREQLVEEFSLSWVPHIHADAAIGWAWSVFNDYDFENNELDFRGRTIRALAAAKYRIRHMHLADSICLDFHKTGFAPYPSSAFLVKQRSDLDLIARNREAMPYLYQTGDYHPGMFTLETSRGGGGPLAALANLLLLGKEGLRTLLGHLVEMAEVLREELESHPYFAVLNSDNVGPVTLFRVYPKGVDPFTVKQREFTDPSYREQLLQHNEFNRQVYQHVHAEALAGRGVAISQTDCYRHTDYGEPVVALKSYVLSPFSDEAEMQSILERVHAARELIEQNQIFGGEKPTQLFTD
ncbi:MAG: pyridoxal phosphate-dependent decarboxylase family protein [Pirellulaceae bacterium]